MTLAAIEGLLRDDRFSGSVTAGISIPAGRRESCGPRLEQVHALACALMRSVVASMTERLHAIRSQLADLYAPVVARAARPVG